MKTLSAGMQTHVTGQVTTLATLWKLTRPDNTVLGFTDHDVDIVYNGDTYESTTGFTPSAIASRNNLAVDNMEIKGILESMSITEEDLLAGDYDFSTIEIFLINYANVADGVIVMGKGVLGEVSVDRSQYTAEFRSLTQFLQQNIGESYSRLCRVDLGSTECGVNLASFTETGAVLSVTSNSEIITDVTVESDNWFQFGLLTFTSGLNTGRSMEVKSYTQSTGRFVLVQQFPEDIAVSDTFEVYAGCDKLLSTCKNKFNNVINFRGEPYVPGQKALTYKR